MNRIEAMIRTTKMVPAELLTRQARYVHELSDAQLRWLETGVGRAAVIAALVTALPLKFDKSAAADIDGVIELRLVHPDGQEPEQIQIALRSGSCKIRRDGIEKADVTASLRISDLIRLAAGAADAGWLMNDGRIMLSGNTFLFVRFPASFGLRTTPRYTRPRGPQLMGPLSPPR